MGSPAPTADPQRPAQVPLRAPGRAREGDNPGLHPTIDAPLPSPGIDDSFWTGGAQAAVFWPRLQEPPDVWYEDLPPLFREKRETSNYGVQYRAPFR